MFPSFPDKPDHNHLELEILELWERERTFEKLRELNRGGPRFSFVDGPITANNPMGVHHAWGRTLKDVFQRYKALRGFDQRYQNGFDCQGLWVEVEVERALGLNSKREIEEYGLAEFAERCKERVAKFSEVITEQSHAARHVDGLGRGLLHLHRHEHRVHLAFPEDRPRARMALSGPSLDRLVPALRDLDLPARDLRRRVPGARASVALRPVSAQGARRRGALRLDDDTVDASGQRRCRRQPDRGLRPAGKRRLGRDRSLSRRVVRPQRPRRRARRPRVRRAVRPSPRAAGSRPSGDPLGRRRLSTRGRASSTSLRARAPRTSSSPGSTTSPCSRRSTRPGACFPASGSTGSPRTRSPSRSSRTFASADSCARPERSSTAIRPAGAAGRRSSSASSTTGSSRPRRSGSRCSTRTRRSSGRRPSTRSAWTTGCATWGTGTSRASATSVCRCRSIPATTATR